MSSHACAVAGCEENATYRCSKCHTVHYCSIDHQKMNWKFHKMTCGKANATSKPASTSSGSEIPPKSLAASRPPVVSADKATEKRECRCMFCGENLIMESEAEAVEHMRICPALQEQLQSNDQFHIPSMFRDKMG